MKKYFLLLIIILLSTPQVTKVNSVGNGDVVVTWEKTIASTISSRTTGIVKTSDNNYLYACSIFNNSDYTQNLAIYKINGDGNVIWDKKYGFEKTNMTFSNIINTSDNNYLVLGSIDKGEPNVTDFYVMKINNNGEILFNNTFGDINQQSPYSVIETKDNGFIFIGSTYSRILPNPFPYPINIIKIDKNGKLMWQKEFGDINLINTGVGIVEIDGGKFIAIGTQSTNTMSPTYKAYIFCIDSNGNKLWENFFNDNSLELVDKILNVNDGLLIAGYSGDANGNGNTYLRKTDYNLNTIWFKNVELKSVSDFMIVNSNYLICGFDYKQNPFSYIGSVLYTDQNLNTLSKITLSDNYNIQIRSLIKGEDGYFVTGVKYNISKNAIYYYNTTFNQYLVKIEVPETSSNQTSTQNILGYPTPSILIGLMLSMMLIYLYLRNSSREPKQS